MRENSATHPITSEVQPPAGATFADQWGGNPLHRVILCELRQDTDRTPGVTVTVIQWADGSIDTEGVVEPPLVALSGDAGMPVEQARALALCILHAIFRIDEWVK